MNMQDSPAEKLQCMYGKYDSLGEDRRRGSSEQLTSQTKDVLRFMKGQS